MEKELRVGDIQEVEFLRNQKGGKPVCRIEGMIGFIADDVKEFIAPRSVHLVEISAIKEKSLIVTPFEKVKTPYQNLKEVDNAIAGLVCQKEKKVKAKVKYKYQTAQERDSSKK